MNVIVTRQQIRPHAGPQPATEPAAPAPTTPRLTETVARLGRAVARGDVIAARALGPDAVAQARDADAVIRRQAERIAAIERLCVTDDLTGILNRRGFEGALRRAVASARRYRETGVLVFIDLDGFKPINDTFGHAAGDAVLVRLARVLDANVRETDAAGRLGGDEFAVLLARTGRDDGLARAETFDDLINSTTLDWDGTPIAVRASLGFQPYDANSDVEQLLASADEAMYRAKRARADQFGARPLSA